MSESDEPATDLDAQGETAKDFEPTDVSSNYKVLGHNTTASGTTYGVLGQVESADGFGIYTPNDAKIDGETVTPRIAAPANTALVLSTDAGTETLRLGRSFTDNDGEIAGGATVGGHPNNDVHSAAGATVGGGGSSGSQSVAGGTRDNTNEVLDHYGTVSGGQNNRAGSGSNPTTARFPTVGGGFGNTAGAAAATVSGGYNNVASETAATVGGGNRNTSSGLYASVGGGQNNTASGTHAVVGGGGVNTASGFRGTVAGGSGNVANDNYDAIGGGKDNRTGSSGTNSDLFATVGGGQNNVASGEGSTVGGGAGNEATDFDATVGGGTGNIANDNSATVAGGEGNSAGYRATVGGGLDNEASGTTATVGGGSTNTASDSGSTVPGGFLNTASGLNAFAAGSHAMAIHDNSFVWSDGWAPHDTDGDGSADGLSSGGDIAGSGVTGNSTFHVSANGGIRFITGSNAVTYIESDSTGWATVSSRAAKTNVDPVDPGAALAGVDDLELATWEYRDEDGEGAGVTHIGPMAEDFHAAFDVGTSDEHINSVDADGVAFAAIQGLSRELDETRETLDARNDRIEALEVANDAKDRRIDQQAAIIEALDDRLDQLEQQVDATAGPTDE